MHINDYTINEGASKGILKRCVGTNEFKFYMSHMKGKTKELMRNE